MKKISIVIPAKNEEETIGMVLDAVNKISRTIRKKYSLETLVIADHCTDKTAQFAKTKGAKVFKNKLPSGKGNSLKTGFSKAGGDFIVMMDGDYSHRPEDLPKFLKELEKGAGLVIGSRVFGGSDEYTRIRATGNILLTLAFGLLHGRYLSDALNGYKAFRREIFTDFEYDSTDFEIEIELLANTLRKGLEIVEVSSHERKRAGGEAKSKVIQHGSKFLMRIIKEWIKKPKAVSNLSETQIESEWLHRLEKLNKYNEWLFSHIKGYLGKSVWEVGSGVGTYSKYMLGAKTLLLSDIEDDYLKTLKRRFNGSKNVVIERINLTTDDYKKIKVYDIDTVVCINVFEHIRSDLKAMENIYKAINRGGRLLLIVPNHPLLYGSLDRYANHFRRYSGKHLAYSLNKVGFKVEKVAVVNSLAAFNWFLQSRILKKKIVSEKNLKWCERVVPLAKIIDAINPFPVGSNIVVIARK